MITTTMRCNGWGRTSRVDITTSIVLAISAAIRRHLGVQTPSRRHSSKARRHRSSFRNRYPYYMPSTQSPFAYPYPYGTQPMYMISSPPNTFSPGPPLGRPATAQPIAQGLAPPDAGKDPRIPSGERRVQDDGDAGQSSWAREGPTDAAASTGRLYVPGFYESTWESGTFSRTSGHAVSTAHSLSVSSFILARCSSAFPAAQSSNRLMGLIHAMASRSVACEQRGVFVLLSPPAACFLYY